MFMLSFGLFVAGVADQQCVLLRRCRFRDYLGCRAHRRNRDVFPMTPIILPPPAHQAWARAAAIVKELRARKKSDPFCVAAVSNAYAESSWTAVIMGDRDKSFGPWQMNWRFYGAIILAKIGIDIRKEPDVAKEVDAVLFALAQPANAKTLAALDTAKSGAEATRIWARDFERASAGDFVERRVAIAPKIEVWLSKLAT